MDESQLKAQIEVLAAFPAALKAELQSLSDAALRFRPGPEEWSIIEVVGHLAGDRCDLAWAHPPDALDGQPAAGSRRQQRRAPARLPEQAAELSADHAGRAPR